MIKTSTLTSLFLLSALNVQCQWFFQLPTHDLLKDSCVAEIRVEQFELSSAEGWITDTQRDPNEKGKSSNQIAHFYINDFGKVDSNIYYFDGKRFGGFKMKYDAEGNLIETHEFRPDRQYITVNRVEKIEGGYSIKYFLDQKLWKQSMINHDSIFIEDQHGRAQDSIYNRYDPETDENFRYTYIGDSLAATVYIHWKVRNGVPDSLIIISEFFDDRVVRHYDLRGSGRYEGRFRVLSDGSAVIPASSVFHRSATHYNYFNHYDKFRGLAWEPARHFTEDSFPRESQVHLDPRFDNTTHREYCTIHYVYRPVKGY